MRTKTVKKASRNIIEKYYSKLTLDFDTNKRVAEEVAIIQSKRLRNKIAGFTTVGRKSFTSLLDTTLRALACTVLHRKPVCAEHGVVCCAAPDEAHPARPRARYILEAAGAPLVTCSSARAAE